MCVCLPQGDAALKQSVLLHAAAATNRLRASNVGQLRGREKRKGKKGKKKRQKTAGVLFVLAG